VNTAAADALMAVLHNDEVVQTILQEREQELFVSLAGVSDRIPSLQKILADTEDDFDLHGTLRCAYEECSIDPSACALHSLSCLAR
jgi:hypothetical protein